MANTHVFETKMSDRMQVTRFSVPVWAGQASFEERAKLKKGQSVTRPYTSFSREDMGYYTRGTDITPISVDETNETLTIATISMNYKVTLLCNQNMLRECVVLLIV